MKTSAYIKAIAQDNSLPIEQAAVALWLKDLANPFRWTLRPLLQFVFAVLLHLIWFIKRLPLPQFSAHGLLQTLICWFCKNLVSYEANMLILRHYTTESNILNFLIANHRPDNSDDIGPNTQLQFIDPLKLYPQTIDDMQIASFVNHDQELFRVFAEMGPWQHAPFNQACAQENLKWDNWVSITENSFQVERKATQVLDFESAHALFMCLFCFLLKRDEYRDAINGFNLDQSMAIRIGQLVGNPTLTEMAYNKYPHYLVGPWNLGQRFLMHGFFTEYMYAFLEPIRKQHNTSAIDE